jgi:hypothetical protein
MAISTFDGPVRSLNGFYAQGPGNVVSITSSTTLSVAAHAGKVIKVGGTLASDLTITLPAINTSASAPSAGPGADPNTQNNQGAVFTIWVDATIATSSLKIASDGTDKYIGSVLSIDSDSSGAMAGFVPAAANDFINLNGSDTGGLVGTCITITSLTTNKYMVNGVIVCTGTPATPFANS